MQWIPPVLVPCSSSVIITEKDTVRKNFKEPRTILMKKAGYHMKFLSKTLGKSILLVLSCTMVGLLLLIAVFAIPTDRMEEHVLASAAVFEEEGAYPEFNILGTHSTLDNWTDAIMLLQASYCNDTGLLDRAISVYRPTIEWENPAQVLVSYYTQGAQTQIISYPRYWHGYLVFLKPLLCVFSYDQIRILNAVFVAVLALLFIAVMYYKKMARYILPYVIALLLIDPFAISQSIQFTTIYYIYTIASIVLLLKQDWLEASVERLALFFVVIGCATSYFDFLTYPLVTFGVPAILFLCSTKKPLKKTAKILLLVLVCWFIGYAGMWAGKWILGTLLGNENIIMDAISSIFLRSSTLDVSGQSFSLFSVLKAQLYHIITPAFGFAAVYVIVMGICFWKHNPKKKRSDFTWTLYIGIALLPILWFVGASNHSYVHHWFTYRELLTSAFSVMCLFARYATKTDAIARREK